MRRPEFDRDFDDNAGLAAGGFPNLLFTVERPPQVEAYGELKPVALDPFIEKAHAVPDQKPSR